jgi:effector-binding domain-containing protein
MIVTEPKIDTRSEKPYVGIRTQVSMGEMGSGLIPQLIGEVFGWLGQRGIAPAGAPFMRFYVIDMADHMDVEIGVPVAAPVQGDGRVQGNTLPAGRYASLIYTGVENGYEGNKVLIEWANNNGIQWDRWDDPHGDAFRSRYEIYIDGPDDDPNPANWRTEVAIKLADDQQ